MTDLNEVLKAQTNKVRLARLKGELVERSQVVAHVFKLARDERDAWLNWPARVIVTPTNLELRLRPGGVGSLAADARQAAEAVAWIARR